MTEITKNFSLEEFAVSASHPELVVPVPASKQPRLIALVATILQPARDGWGKEMHVLSGYRSEALNKAAGGSPTSQHRMAEAADIATDNPREFFFWLMQSNLPLGQVIYYPHQNFVHIALPSTHYPKPSFFVSRYKKSYERVYSEAGAKALLR